MSSRITNTKKRVDDQGDELWRTVSTTISQSRKRRRTSMGLSQASSPSISASVTKRRQSNVASPGPSNIVRISLYSLSYILMYFIDRHPEVDESRIRLSRSATSPSSRISLTMLLGTLVRSSYSERVFGRRTKKLRSCATVWRPSVRSSRVLPLIGELIYSL